MGWLTPAPIGQMYFHVKIQKLLGRDPAVSFTFWPNRSAPTTS